MNKLFGLILLLFVSCSNPVKVQNIVNDYVEPPFTICLTGDINDGWVQIYEYNGTKEIIPLGPMLLKIKNDSCVIYDVPDGLQLVAYYLYGSMTGIPSNARRSTFITRRGDYWNL